MLPRGRIDSQWRKTFEAKHPILTEEVEDNGRRQKLAADLKASGNAAFKANSMREALVLYTRALELTPSDHTLHGNSSAVQLQLGDFTAALSCAKEAIRLDVSWGKGYFRKAQALEKLERYSEASHAMEEAIRRTDGEKGKNVPMMRKVLFEYQEKAVVATHGALDRPMSITSAAGSSRAGQPQSQGNAGSVLTELLAKTICLTGLPDEHSVREFCGQFGSVLGVSMFKSWFVTFEKADAANECISMGVAALTVPGEEIVVTLQSSTKTWDATLKIISAGEAEAKQAKQLAAHSARMAVLVMDACISSEDKGEEENDEEQQQRRRRQENEEQNKNRREGEEAEAEAAATTSKHDASTDVDLLIVGAGASGVGCGVMARQFGFDPDRTLIIERGSAVGSTFEQWPEEMRFITPSFNQQAFGMMDLNSVAYDTSPAQMFHEEVRALRFCSRSLRSSSQEFSSSLDLLTDAERVLLLLVAMVLVLVVLLLLSIPQVRCTRNICASSRTSTSFLLWWRLMSLL